jgi:hypothetical protein
MSLRTFLILAVIAVALGSAFGLFVMHDTRVPARVLICSPGAAAGSLRCEETR